MRIEDILEARAIYEDWARICNWVLDASAKGNVWHVNIGAGNVHRNFEAPAQLLAPALLATLDWWHSRLSALQAEITERDAKAWEAVRERLRTLADKGSTDKSSAKSEGKSTG